jgi:predicted DNA-binding transcriptional regulator AlpA
MKNCHNCGADIGPLLTYCSKCELLTINEALALLRLSRASFYRLVRAGRITPRHPTVRRTLVARADIDRILAGSN